MPPAHPRCRSHDAKIFRLLPSAPPMFSSKCFINLPIHSRRRISYPHRRPRWVHIGSQLLQQAHVYRRADWTGLVVGLHRLGPHSMHLRRLCGLLRRRSNYGAKRRETLSIHGPRDCYGARRRFGAAIYSARTSARCWNVLKVSVHKNLRHLLTRSKIDP